ncbi:uncharacterized protein LOC134844604 [Symsagittifera roscoffensis]|uniref:uncharacterized protein LOC134844604 n=1 Tax=Symsagittifera roscoffensis TaxID=84072 RepID=UPI00307BA884
MSGIESYSTISVFVIISAFIFLTFPVNSQNGDEGNQGQGQDRGQSEPEDTTDFEDDLEEDVEADDDNTRGRIDPDELSVADDLLWWCDFDTQCVAKSVQFGRDRLHCCDNDCKHDECTSLVAFLFLSITIVALCGGCTVLGYVGATRCRTNRDYYPM